MASSQQICFPTARPDAMRAASTKPLPRDMSHHFSETTKHRSTSKVKEYYKFFQIPGIGNLAGGLPNVRYFPFDTLEAQIAQPERWTPSPHRPGSGEDDDAVLVDALSASTVQSARDPAAPSHLVVPKTAPEQNPLKKIDLATALQYGQGSGYPPLLSWIRQFTRECLHPSVPYRNGPEVVLTVGATDGMAKALELLVNPWSPNVHDIRDRPGLLCEKFIYSNVLNQSVPKGVQIVIVESDDEGMSVDGPGGLEDVLGNWDDSKGKRPNMMYTVTMGHNPTGYLLSKAKREKIYAVCSKYDVIIIEDDPYWYLQFPSAAIDEAKARGLPIPATVAAPAVPAEESSGSAFIDSLVPSFLSVDIDGRVIRLDTFSKTVAPGCRLGWVTAQPELIERITRISEATTQQPSGFVQAMISELVLGPEGQQDTELAAFNGLRSAKDRANFAGWKTDGWVRWLEGLRGEYERRMNRMCTILDEGCFQLKQSTPMRASDGDWGVVTKTQLYSFEWPRAGMFVWLRIFFERHPLWQAVNSHGEIVDGSALCQALLLFLCRKPYLVLMAPGMMFSANEDISREIGWAYHRACFAAEAEEVVDDCSRRFVAGIHRFWKIKKVKELEDILNNPPSGFAEMREEGLVDLGSWGGC